MQFDSGARYIDPAADEALHHDLFVDVLRAAMERRGTIRDVAARSGFSEQYLHLILSKRRSVPSHQALERIINAMPHATVREAWSLREYGRRASGDFRAADRGSLRRVKPQAEVISDLERLERRSHEATHASSPDETKLGLLSVKAGTSELLKAILDPLADLPTYIRLCLLRSHVQNFLDDPPDALKWTRVAKSMVEDAKSVPDLAMPCLDDLHVDVLMSEAVALHNLDRDHLALHCYDDALQLVAGRSRDPRRVHIAMGRITSLAATRRFRMADIHRMVDDVHRECDKDLFSDAERDLHLFRTQRSLAAAYVRHGDLKPRTERLIRGELERMENVVLLGPIHEVQFYRTAATFSAKRGDRNSLDLFVELGSTTAQEAGLSHQSRRIKEEFVEFSGFSTPTF